jgi:hypothetical protein
MLVKNEKNRQLNEHQALIETERHRSAQELQNKFGQIEGTLD